VKGETAEGGDPPPLLMTIPFVTCLQSEENAQFAHPLEPPAWYSTQGVGLHNVGFGVGVVGGEVGLGIAAVEVVFPWVGVFPDVGLIPAKGVFLIPFVTVVPPFPILIPKIRAPTIRIIRTVKNATLMKLRFLGVAIPE